MYICYIGFCGGLLCAAGDVLQLREGPIGMVAKLFVEVNGDIYIMGCACSWVKTQSQSSAVWRASTSLTFEPLSRVAARCAWAPMGSDILVVRSAV